MTGIIQFLLLVSATVASEPSNQACSRYDYEEKMLERMIRMEFAFEKLGEKVEQNLNNIKDEKERLRSGVDVMKEQEERKLASLMKEVARNQSSTLNKVVTGSKNSLEQMNAAFSNIQEQIATPLVYFHAHSPQTSILSTGEVIVYKTVEANQGNGYSSTTGKFTAPVRGLYLIFMHTCTATNKIAYLQMVKDDSVLTASKQYGNDVSSCSSSQAFTWLDAWKTGTMLHWAPEQTSV